jgi:hypothetical protein
VIAQQIDDRLQRCADFDHASGQRFPGELATETPQQWSLPVFLSFRQGRNLFMP